MGSNDISQVNAAYIASWKQLNPKLRDLETDGYFLKYLNEEIDIREIYMQDILNNSNLFYSLDSIEEQDLFNIIRIHVDAIKIKEEQLKNKMRRFQSYEY